MISEIKEIYSMADFLTETDEKLLERRMKERSLITGLDVSSKKKKAKEFKKLAKDLAMRVQLSKEKVEGSIRQMEKQTNTADAANVAQDKVIKDACVKELVEVVAEASEIQKTLQIAIEEGADTARSFNEENFSFSLSEKDRKDVAKIKRRNEEKRKEKRKKKKGKRSKNESSDSNSSSGDD